MVRQLLRESVTKFKSEHKFTMGDNNKENDVSQTSSRSIYDQVLSKQHSQRSLISPALQPQITATLSTHTVQEFKAQVRAWLRQENEREYRQRGLEGVKREIEDRLREAKVSDHGMLDYMIDLWEALFTAYQTRLSQLTILSLKDTPRQIYLALEQETTNLSAFKSETQEIYQMIHRKEEMVGNMFTERYHKVEHKSELFGLRAQIVKKIEEYQKMNKKGKVMWHGIPYAEICRLERQESEAKVKEEIREEIESKRLKRATTYTTYARLMN